jgi:hypothetical protein
MNVCLINGTAIPLNCLLNATDNSVSECELKCQNFKNCYSLHFKDEVTIQQSQLIPTAQVKWMMETALQEKQTTQQR